MEKLRVAIVGCGGIANQKHMPSLKANADKAEMVAFCDIIPERAEKAAKEYGAEGAKVYTDYKEMLADKSVDIDVVHVCTPNVAHCPITVAAFEAGKHVMCEKPMAHNTEDAQKMLDAWKASGKKFTIGYQNRLRDDTQTLHASCENGELGDIYFAKAHALRRRAVPTWGVFPNKALQTADRYRNTRTGHHTVDDEQLRAGICIRTGILQTGTSGRRSGRKRIRTMGSGNI